MRYILLLRGINVGGKNRVKMEVFKNQLYSLGFQNVISYINSGNLIFESTASVNEIKNSLIKMMDDNYEFKILFALINEKNYLETANHLPRWWHDDNLARRDVLFYTDVVDRVEMIKSIQSMELYNEIVHYSEIAIFWGKINEKDYMKTAYHKNLASKKYYKEITIRNGNTFDKLLSILFNNEN